MPRQNSPALQVVIHSAEIVFAIGVIWFLHWAFPDVLGNQTLQTSLVVIVAAALKALRASGTTPDYVSSPRPW